jgi:vacuolar-type H+-ATPase subunit I/STV1
MKKLSYKTFRKIGYILIPIGILGGMIGMPHLCRPRYPTESYFFWKAVKETIFLIMVLLGLIGFLSLIIGIVWYTLKSLKQYLMNKK